MLEGKVEEEKESEAWRDVFEDEVMMGPARHQGQAEWNLWKLQGRARLVWR